MSNLFDNLPSDKKAPFSFSNEKKKGAKSVEDRANGYTASDIQILEGLEPVRHRPGMYIGGTDIQALHHLVAEILDNAMDEVVSGYASRIDVEILEDGSILIQDNGRGIPVDPHPKFPDKSALEIILTTLHAGGKFDNKSYAMSGGLHGVGASVVNALSSRFFVEVAREQTLWQQEYKRGEPLAPLKNCGTIRNRRGTKIIFFPDSEIFGSNVCFDPQRIFEMARSRAYLFKGVKIHWDCSSFASEESSFPLKEILYFPKGLEDCLMHHINGRPIIGGRSFCGSVVLPNSEGRVEWAIAWLESEEPLLQSYCNTIPTVFGGTHETGLRNVLQKGIRAYGDLIKNRHAAKITAEDMLSGAYAFLSLFIHDPLFQGQTKERLSTPFASRLVENALRDHFDHWLTHAPESTNSLFDFVLTKAEARLRRRQEKQTSRQSATRRLRLPGKLTDCSRTLASGTEIFLVEGDSAGGSAKQARDRKTQAILPLRGKILNVASASEEKIMQNNEIRDLIEALGCGTKASYTHSQLRYERVIIMTDADVDGAHIASLLMTFFFQHMPELVQRGALYLAMPPLYRLSYGSMVFYARDDAHRDELLRTVFTKKKAIDISRFKGLGEMPPAQLRDTTMSPENRTLLRVYLPPQSDEYKFKDVAQLVETLMGKKPEKRFNWIQENASFAKNIDI